MRAIILNEFVTRLDNGPWEAMTPHALMAESQDFILLRRDPWVIAVCVGRPRTLSNQKRKRELIRSLPIRVVKIAFVAVFQSRAEFQQHIEAIPSNTSVWFADEPDHIIHFGRVPFFRLKPRLCETE